MGDPRPVHMQTDDDLRRLGWWAAERDGDGHLVSVMTTPDVAGRRAVADFFAAAAEKGHRAYTL